MSEKEVTEPTHTEVVVETGNPSESGEGNSGDHHQLSKRGLKRLEKKRQWDVTKKLKRKLKKEQRRALPVEERSKGKRGGRRRKAKKMQYSDCKSHVVIDLSFDDLMNNKDVCRCVNQINRCYSSNRILENPMQFHVTSFNGPSKTEMEKQTGFVNWDVVFHEKPYHEIFEKSRLVYLTSESTNVLTELEDDKVYIIGGLVDHNSKKGLCHKLAVEKGIAHARLPIPEFVSMNSRFVLSINQVFAILGYVSNGMKWQESILKSIPPRKNAHLKNTNTESESSGDDNNHEVSKDDETEQTV